MHRAAKASTTSSGMPHDIPLCSHFLSSVPRPPLLLAPVSTFKFAFRLFSLNRLYSISDVRSGARRWERVGVSLAGCPRWLPMALLRRTSVVQVYRHRAARGLLLGLIACNFHAGLPGPSSQLPQNVGRPRHCCTVSHTRLRGGANTAGGGDGLAGAFRCRPAHMLPRVLVSTIPCVSDIHTLSS
jgi:hypothetical protein